jgi:hypothetical protein
VHRCFSDRFQNKLLFMYSVFMIAVSAGYLEAGIGDVGIYH